MNRLILASSSPRRRELLHEAGVAFDVESSNFKEDMSLNIPPKRLVEELSAGKALDIAKRHADEDRIVLGADTVVVQSGEVIGKPIDKEDAKRILSSLSGNEHSVFTGVTLVDTVTNVTESFSVETKIRFRELSQDEIDTYITSGEPMDKAGAYGIQAGARDFVETVDGDFSNVVGLPIDITLEHLKSLGVIDAAE